VQARVASLVSDMPPVVYARLLEGLVRPFLASLSEILPSLFPIAWTRQSPPSQPPVGAAGVVCGHLSLRCLFRRMCECMARPVDAASSGVDASLLVRTIVSGGESIYSRLLTRRRLLWGGGGPAARNRFRVCIVRIQAQIEAIRGTDVVFHRLRSQIEDLNSSLAVSYTPTGLCRFACSVGMVEQMLQLALRFRVECFLVKESRLYLGELIALLRGVLWTEQQLRLAVAMALHARLGAASALGALGVDLLPLCVPTVICKPIGTWTLLLDELNSTGVAARPRPPSLAPRLRLGGGAAP
jgi:hypothetical protein